jgi:DUF4097 and DUF4098 domain-containing protein YvlB
MILRHAVAAAALSLVAGYACADQTVDKTVPADAQGEVEISSVSGTVSVTGWDRNEVHVTGTLDRDVERLDFDSDEKGKRTVIKVVLRHGSHYGSSDTELSVRVPKRSHIDVNTVSAELSVDEVLGGQRLQTVSADLTTTIGDGEVEVKTVSGGVTVRGDNKPGMLNVTTVSGDAHVTRAAGEITASTVSGELELVLDKVSRARLRTTSGDIIFTGTLLPKATIDGETISGELKLDLKGKSNAQFDLESFSGEIETCTGQEAQSTNKYGPGKELHYANGDGSARVRLSSLSGSIQLCAR